MIRNAIRTTMLAVVLIGAPAAVADYAAGQQAWDAGRPAEALSEWRSAADAGDRRAMLALGRRYAQGLGVVQDYVEAHKWLNLAASLGEAAAVEERDALAARMTPQQVATAQERAAAWRPGANRAAGAVKIADTPGTAGAQAAAPASDAGPPLPRAIREAQALLAALGYAPGPADGIWGRRTGQAYQAFLRDAGQPVAERLTPEALRAMRTEIVALLVEAEMGAKADILLKGSEGKTAVDVARFRDCDDCPELVVVPAGSFKMGSPEWEAGRLDDEGPVHWVRIERPFAVGVYEVTFAEWDACVSGGGCGGYRPGDEGWGRGNRPVINVSWKDARSYVGWLSEETGEEYRLLSESEWEYVARGGTRTPFHTGETISTEQANYDLNNWGTVAVGSFDANGYGLHDVHGNVWEWVEDCWNSSYRGREAPADGSAWESGDCSRRVLRGGSWLNSPWILRSARRLRFDSGHRNYNAGFRVGRTLTP